VPDTIVAPPKVMRRLAESGRLAAQHLFRGAEVLDSLGRVAIEAATCGGFARSTWRPKACSASAARTARCTSPRMSCEWLAAGESGLVTPLVTDFRIVQMAPDRVAA
jgi:hypothetical protein